MKLYSKLTILLLAVFLVFGASCTAKEKKVQAAAEEPVDGKNGGRVGSASAVLFDFAQPCPPISVKTSSMLPSSRRTSNAGSSSSFRISAR